MRKFHWKSSGMQRNWRLAPPRVRKFEAGSQPPFVPGRQLSSTRGGGARKRNALAGADGKVPSTRHQGWPALYPADRAIPLSSIDTRFPGLAQKFKEKLGPYNKGCE